ncbi:apolipoprotein L3-like [Acomys russatus]|uniref:apolipoprotein L3-like n=1 Tax=Acomys russatus TaxID=60746 RepID=UPI0021E2D9AA|nr:apolipoprotein L3-like [Acomys russatus]
MAAGEWLQMVLCVHVYGEQSKCDIRKRQMFHTVDVARHVGEEVADHLTEILSREDLERLRTKDGYWKAFVEAAELSSKEEAALHDALHKHLTQPPTEDDHLQREEQRKRFLEEFPPLKSKLEEHIRKLRDLADHLDQVHRGCTISNVVSGSASTASGVLGILGLVLAPFTAGASLTLSATSLGLGVAASMSGVPTTMVEDLSRLSDEAEASRLVGASMDILNAILKILPKITVKLVKRGVDLFGKLKALRDHIRAIRAARAGSRSAQASRHVRSTLADSARPMTRGARIIKGAVTSIFLGLDVYHLVVNSKDLYEGQSLESARALRDLAHKLEEKLQEFGQTHSALQSALSQ